MSKAVVLQAPGRIDVRDIPVPKVGGPSVRVALGACGICGSDVRYYAGENPWAMHTLGYHVDSPPNMVIGHEVSGTTVNDGARVAILAFKSCGVCRYCSSGRENLCEDMEHFGHSAGWGDMDYYPGGMSEQFDIWDGFAYPIPESVSFEEATFLDGLAVAVHAVDVSGLTAGGSLAVVGLGPIGMLAAQVGRAIGAELVAGCDTATVPVRLAKEVGIAHAVHGSAADLARASSPRAGGVAKSTAGGFDAVIDTVGNADSISEGLKLLDKSGALVLLAVHAEATPLETTLLSGERRVMTSANNRYRDFPAAIDLLGSGAVRVQPLVTHRFPLDRAQEAFEVMLEKEARGAFKVVLTP